MKKSNKSHKHAKKKEYRGVGKSVLSFVEMWRWENGVRKTVEKVVEIVENMWR